MLRCPVPVRDLRALPFTELFDAFFRVPGLMLEHSNSCRVLSPRLVGLAGFECLLLARFLDLSLAVRPFETVL